MYVQVRLYPPWYLDRVEVGSGGLPMSLGHCILCIVDITSK